MFTHVTWYSSTVAKPLPLGSAKGTLQTISTITFTLYGGCSEKNRKEKKLGAWLMPCRVRAWSIGMYHTGLTALFRCLLLLHHKYKLVE